MNIELTPIQIRLLTEQLLEQYKLSPGKRFWQGTGEQFKYLSTTELYRDLAEQIKPDQIIVKEEWLATLFTKKLNSGKAETFQSPKLNSCCAYLGASSAAAFFASFQAKPAYFGTYRVWWTGTTLNSPYAVWRHEFDVVIGQDKIDLKDEQARYYQGRAAILLNHKLHLEFTNTGDTEKVYFILHIGEADPEDLRHLPGVFSAGDSGNTNPCCGPVLFERNDQPVHEKLIEEYFTNFRGNNLIRSWNISSVLEARRRFDIPGQPQPVPVKPSTDNILSYYFGQTFHVYYYKTFYSAYGVEDGIGRAVLTIGQTPNDVTMLASTSSNSAITYRGSIALMSHQILSIKMLTLTNERDLCLKFKIGTGEVSPFALGSYSNIGNQGEPVAGTVMLEHVSDPTKVAEAVIWEKNDSRCDAINPNIRRFFANRKQNFIATRSKGILSEKDFFEFFRDQEFKKHSVTPFIPGRSNVFIATAMSSQLEDFQELQPVVKQMILFMRAEFDLQVYYAGENHDPEQAFTLQSYLAAQIDFHALEQADHVFFIHPRRAASSSLVEIGYALGQNKMCHIFCRDRKDLPFILRNLQQPNVRYYEFEELSHLLRTVHQIFTVHKTPKRPKT
ncbi:MAG: hypothetical protein IT260_23565 [Saprospiraceae bacterium]|nr:hypothetical protein [Saprospiraceae bacterium]